MTDSLKRCPQCRASLAVEEIAPSPFACPRCEGVIEPASHYERHFGAFGLLLVVVAASAGLYALGMTGGLAIVIGLVSGLFLYWGILEILGRLFPRPPVLQPYVCRTGEDPSRLAEFVESVVAASQWDPAFDQRLSFIEQESSLEDTLENEVVEAARKYKALLETRASSDAREKKRMELSAIARALRATARSLPPPSPLTYN